MMHMMNKQDKQRTELIERWSSPCEACGGHREPKSYGIAATETSYETNPLGDWNLDKRVVLEIIWACENKCPAGFDITEHIISPKNLARYIELLSPEQVNHERR